MLPSSYGGELNAFSFAVFKIVFGKLFNYYFLIFNLNAFKPSSHCLPVEGPFLDCFHWERSILLLLDKLVVMIPLNEKTSSQCFAQ